MILSGQHIEPWVELHYEFKNRFYKFNLPLPQGVKFLDGLKIELERQIIDGGWRISIRIEPLGNVRLIRFELTGRMDYGDDLQSIFVNGYQSQTGSRERSPAERIAAMNWPGKILSLENTGDTHLYPYSERKGCFHGFTYAFIRYPNRLFFAGSLNGGFTILETDVRKGLFSVRRDVNGMRFSEQKLILDMALLEGSEQFVFSRYAELKGQGSVRPGIHAAAWSAKPFSGKEEIQNVLEEVSRLKIPLRYFIINDDLAETNPATFETLAKDIRERGFIPGISFCPFAVSANSALFHSRPEWLARSGRLKPAGRFRNAPFFALDLTREDVRNHIAEKIRRLHDDLKFGLFKMDLLFASSLFPAPGKSRGETTDDAMEFLFSLKGSADFLFSAVPLESAAGRAEYCRVTPDSTPHWENFFYRNIHFRERASTVSNLKTAIGRRQLNGLFFSSENDCFFLKGGRKMMEPARRYTQLLIHALLGNLLTTSDDISAYSKTERDLFLSLFPLRKPRIEEVSEFRRTVKISYTVAEHHYICFSNLSERIRHFRLPEGRWFGTSGLKPRPHHIAGSGKLYLRPGESKNYLNLDTSGPVAGGDDHLFPGSSIASAGFDGKNWDIVPAKGVLKDFRIWLLSDGRESVTINHIPAEIKKTPWGGFTASAIIRTGQM